MKLICGPCVAESYNQLRSTIVKLIPLNIDAFRAGVWKSRTRIGEFEGAGIKALEWLMRIKDEFNIPIATEVILPEHVELALKYHIDIIWIGARTTVNPFICNEIIKALKEIRIPILIKNPITPDKRVLFGIFERFINAGQLDIKLIHRGFCSTTIPIGMRNDPVFDLIDTFRKEWCNIPIYLDPSHLTGNSLLIENLILNYYKKYNGLFIECHYKPKSALSDCKQQITPLKLSNIFKKIKIFESQ